MKHEKPLNVSTAEWKDIQKSIQTITEHYQNIALFVNWVDDAGSTQHFHILKGNAFALQNHINKWVDGEFDELFQDDEEEDDDDKIKRAY